MEPTICIRILSLAGATLFLGDESFKFDKTGVAVVPESRIARIRQEYPDVAICGEEPEIEPGKTSAPETVRCSYPGCSNVATWKSLDSVDPSCFCDDHVIALLTGTESVRVADEADSESPAPENEDGEKPEVTTEGTQAPITPVADVDAIRVFVDGDQVCAMLGDDLATGVAAFLTREDGITGEVTEAERGAVLAKWVELHGEAPPTEQAKEQSESPVETAKPEKMPNAKGKGSGKQKSS
jgi:hypothetical protein